MGDDPADRLVGGTTGFEFTTMSFSCWVKTTDTAHGKNLYTKLYYTPDRGIRSYIASSTSAFVVVIYDGSTSNTLYESQVSLTDGDWHHIVWTLSAADNEMELYVDGSPSPNSPWSTTIDPSYYANNTPIYIGNSIYEDDGFYGSIDEFGVWDRVLTSTEVTQLYNSGNGITYNP